MKKNRAKTDAADFFVPEFSPEEIARERAKARELRNTQWWKRRRSTGICYYCTRKFKPSELTLDHIVPLIRGGRTSKGNVVPACKDCNNRKKYLLPMEWQEYLDSVRSREEV